jgi:hypothetical protein
MKTAMIYCSPSILEITLNSLLVSTQSYLIMGMRMFEMGIV